MRNWIIGIAIAVGVYGVNTMMRADRDSSGAIVSEGSIDAFAMHVGDCFDDGSTFSGDSPEVSSVAGIPCSTPHDNEVYAVFDVAVASFPDGDGMASLAFDSCKERFEAFVGKDYDASSLDIATLYPTRESWNGQHDREVVCAVYDVDQQKLTGSAKNQRL